MYRWSLGPAARLAPIQQGFALFLDGAAVNRKKPGIIETTAEKATAAKGRCRRSTTGVTMTLTSRQATSAPVAAFVPATEISAQRAACASMPAAIGNASRRHGIEKKVP